MEITEVRIKLKDDGKLRAFARLTFDDCFVVRGLKVIEGSNGMFVAMPSRKKPDGTFQDVAHPITNEMRQIIEKRVMEEYQQELEREHKDLVEDLSADDIGESEQSDSAEPE